MFLPFPSFRDYLFILTNDWRIFITFSLGRFVCTGTFSSIIDISYHSFFGDARHHPELQRLHIYGATSSCINLIIKKTPEYSFVVGNVLAVLTDMSGMINIIHN